VYGCRIKGNYRRLVQSLARGRFIPVGNGSNRRTLVYDKDVARAAVLAAIHPDAAGRIFNVTDEQFHTMKAIIETLCDALGRKPPTLALPLIPVRWAAGLLEESSKLVHLMSPVTRETITKYTEDMAVDSQRIRKELGFAPRYDLVSGWKETVQEMRQAGIL
jgi:nucleoside-diphosphate-sugar epimerase